MAATIVAAAVTETKPPSPPYRAPRGLKTAPTSAARRQTAHRIAGPSLPLVCRSPATSRDELDARDPPQAGEWREVQQRAVLRTDGDLDRVTGRDAQEPTL